jgi:hypothetical protein
MVIGGYHLCLTVEISVNERRDRGVIVPLSKACNLGLLFHIHRTLNPKRSSDSALNPSKHCNAHGNALKVQNDSYLLLHSTRRKWSLILKSLGLWQTEIHRVQVNTQSITVCVAHKLWFCSLQLVKFFRKATEPSLFNRPVINESRFVLRRFFFAEYNFNEKKTEENFAREKRVNISPTSPCLERIA